MTSFRERTAFLESLIAELTTFVQDVDLRPLTLKQAADLSGYSVDHLGRLIREGRLPNAGRPNAPRIVRRDIPLKTGLPRVDIRSEQEQTDPVQIVRSVIDQG